MTTPQVPPEKPAPESKSPVYYYFGGACLLVALGLAVWGFREKDLTYSQILILKFALPVAAGLAAGAFVGHATGTLGGVVGTLTGGFLVWWLTSTFIKPPDAPFVFTVFVDADPSFDWSATRGTVRLELPDPKSATINQGSAILTHIPAALANTSQRLVIDVEGYTPVRSTIVLKPNQAANVAVQLEVRRGDSSGTKPPSPYTASPTPVPPGSYRHVGPLGALQDHIVRRVSREQFVLALGLDERAALRGLWIDPLITADTWGELFAKICERYDKCLRCTPDPDDIKTRVTIELRNKGAIVRDPRRKDAFACRG